MQLQVHHCLMYRNLSPCSHADQARLLQSSANQWQVESQTITQGGAVAFLVIASGSLLVLYFFLDTAFYIILVRIFTAASLMFLWLLRYIPCTQDCGSSYCWGDVSQHCFVQHLSDHAVSRCL